MNERIKELAKQAGILCKPRQLFDDNEPDGYLCSDNDHFADNYLEVRAFFDGGLDKFAELIIEECADNLVQANMSNPAYAKAMDAYYEQKWAHRFD